MKKQVGLIALIALIVSFMAFSGVVSAQASNVQVVLFTSPMCSVCQVVEPRVQSAAAQYGVTLIIHDVSTAEGKGIAQANGVSGTPTIIISGAKSATFNGDVSQAQIAAAIKAAIGTATPTPKKTVVKAVATPVKAVATPVKAVAVVKATTAPTTVKATTQPTIEVATATPTTSTTKTVPEFSMLGLGAPALIVGAIYLFLRRQ